MFLDLGKVSAVLVRTKYMCTYRLGNTKVHFSDSTYKLKELTFHSNLTLLAVKVNGEVCALIQTYVSLSCH